ncbi:MAG: DNA mismatch repair endonuclease MutL [Candidatus Lambdaproteobacteria bacterium]|nr:DNA mismatch repair endonuclease MutL [Candidatus Lambdaproteobacteria bacterium]
MGQIQILPDPLINQIAAGEVVERPASVAKELVENALDAGATQVTLTIEEGGRELVAVVDNGSGMDEADARLAVVRHATSKLGSAADLMAIRTLGFRGEALASIAAVSRFELVTCSDERAGGVRVAVEGGRELAIGRVGFARGTRVTVRELFFNTPARRKFLRSAPTEFQHLHGILVQAALAHPEVQFRLVHNHKSVAQWPACGSLAERAWQVLGPELAEGLLPLAAAEGELTIEGLFSSPSHSQGSRRWQFLFVNGRPVRSAALGHAVYQGYRTLLMKDRHPAYLLKLGLPPGEVDVNVHPAKTEVRLRNAQLVHTVLADRLHKGLLEASRRRAFGRETPPLGALAEASALAEAALAAAASPSTTAAQFQPSPLALFPALPERTVPPGRAMAAVQPAPPEAPPAAAPRAAGLRRAGAEPPAGAPAPAALSGAPALAALPGAGAGGLAPNPFSSEAFLFQGLSAGADAGAAPDRGVAVGAPAASSAALPGLGPRLVVVGQLQATYLLAQREDGLVIVDQHAAHERILFEQYRRQFYAGRLVTERYLVPLTLELSPQNALLLEQYLPQFRRMGFEFEPFGRSAYLLREVPALIAGRDIARLVLEVLDELSLFGKSGRLEEAINEILERVACHAALRAGDGLSRPEMEALLAQLEQLDINLYCPHGRPVWIELSSRELEKRFKRIV